MRGQVISLLQVEIPNGLQSKLVYTFPPPNFFHYHLCKRNQGKIIPISQKIALNRSSVIKEHLSKEFSKSLRTKLIGTNQTSTENHYNIHWKIFVKYLRSLKLELNQSAIHKFFTHSIDRKSRQQRFLPSIPSSQVPTNNSKLM